MIQRCFSLAALLLSLTLTAQAQTDPKWTSYLLWDAGEKIQGVLFGDVDARRKGVEGIGVSQAGVVGIGGLEKGQPWHEVIYDHPAKLQSILFEDVDPRIPGRELYVAGAGVSSQGQVLQIVRSRNAWRVRTVWEGGGFVHAMAKLPGRNAKDPTRLVVAAYDGKVYRATPTVDGVWTEDLLYQRPLTGDSSQIKWKDVAIGKLKGVTGRRIVASALDGQVMLLDPDGGRPAEPVHFEEKGVARISLAADGTLYGACNNGNVLRFNLKNKKWTVDTMFTDEAELRGVRIGMFKTSKGPARFAIYGYSGKLHALLASKGKKLEPQSLYADGSKAHAIDMADAIKGNGSDELLVGGYAGKLILVAHR